MNSTSTTVDEMWRGIDETLAGASESKECNTGKSGRLLEAIQ